jgi:hypothetical protein
VCRPSPDTPSELTAARTRSSAAPASTRAARSMSPATPADASTQHAGAGSATGHQPLDPRVRHCDLPGRAPCHVPSSCPWRRYAAPVVGLPIWLLFLLLVIVAPGLVVGLQVLVRRRWPHLAEGDHNDVAGFIIAIVGVIYAVLLAFVVIVSWQQFSEAANTVGEEASALRGLYRETVAYPPEVRRGIQDDVRSYAEAAITREWTAMGRGEPGDPAVAAALDRLAEHLAALPTDTPVRQEYVAVEADRFAELVSFRSQRLDFVGQGLPGVLWVALAIGGVVTVGFAMIFGLRSTLLHLIMTGSLAAVIGVLLFVAVAIDQPFVGDVAVAPAPLERFLTDFGGH